MSMCCNKYKFLPVDLLHKPLRQPFMGAGVKDCIWFFVRQLQNVYCMPGMAKADYAYANDRWYGLPHLYSAPILITSTVTNMYIVGDWLPCSLRYWHWFKLHVHDTAVSECTCLVGKMCCHWFLNKCSRL